MTQRNKKVTQNNLFFVIVHFILPILLVLTLSKSINYNSILQFFWIDTPVFLKEVFVFQKLCLKVKELKVLKVSSDADIIMSALLEIFNIFSTFIFQHFQYFFYIKTFSCFFKKHADLFWKYLEPFFRIRNYALSVAFKVACVVKIIFFLDWFYYNLIILIK